MNLPCNNKALNLHESWPLSTAESKQQRGQLTLPEPLKTGRAFPGLLAQHSLIPPHHLPSPDPLCISPATRTLPPDTVSFGSIYISDNDKERLMGYIELKTCLDRRGTGVFWQSCFCLNIDPWFLLLLGPQSEERQLARFTALPSPDHSHHRNLPEGEN